MSESEVKTILNITIAILFIALVITVVTIMVITEKKQQ